MSETLLIIDGHSMAFRAFYALPADTFVTHTGQHTNAVYGFTTMLLRLLEARKPDMVAVAFDLPGGSFRHEEYADYKGTREATPEEFKGQIDLVTQVLDAMGIVSLSKEGYEADDILATLAYEGAQAGHRVFVVSGDRDSFQTVNESVTVLYPGMSPGDLREMTPEAIEGKYAVPPHRYPEIAALVGEASDNLPGVPGVGPKTAAQWINKFDGLDNLLARADEVGGKRGEALRQHIEDVRRNRRLNHLLTDVDLGVSVDDLRPRPVAMGVVEELFDTLEFSSLRTRVRKALVTPGEDTHREETPQSVNIAPLEMTIAHEGTDIERWMSQRGRLALWVTGVKQAAVGEVNILAFADEQSALIIDPVSVTPAQELHIAARLREGTLTVHDVKGSAHAVMSRGWDELNAQFDVELAAYLAHPEQRSYEIVDLARRYLHVDMEEPNGASEALFDVDDMNLNEGPTVGQKQAAQFAQILLLLRDHLERELRASGTQPVLDDIEMPVSRVLTRMEDIGIAVDSAYLDDMATQLGREVEDAQMKAFEILGHEVNLQSPKQLQEVLFEELGLPTTKKTKRGYTTNAEALQDLWVRTETEGGVGHEFLGFLLKHRERNKLKQMVESLVSTIRPDGRIHTTFSQTAAATGRLASSDPNLQNIPARTPDGMRIRGAFVAGEHYEALMSADYSQIEMRIMAHLSADEGLIEAFNSGEDLHRTMASMVFETPVDEVTPQQRSRIKATSYGLAYGLSSYGLSQQLRISVPEAAALRDRYFERFGGVRHYLDSLVNAAKEKGFTETICGRRRYLPDLRSDNRQRREMAERAALNAPIQGSAADIIKIAMVNVANAFTQAGVRSRVLVQIHDELLIEIAPGERDEVEEIVRKEMGGAFSMSVPLEVAVGVGASWQAAAH